MAKTPSLRDLLLAAQRAGEEADRDDVEGVSQSSAYPSRMKPVVASFTADQLAATPPPPPRFVVPDLIPEGVVVLGGRPKAGKGWMALDVALAVANGGEALGVAVTEPGDVLFLALEDGQIRIHQRQSQILSTMGANSDAGRAEGSVDGNAGYGGNGGTAGRDHPDAAVAADATPAQAQAAASRPMLERLTYHLVSPPQLDEAIDALRTWAAAAKTPRLIVIDLWARFAPRGRRRGYDGDYEAVGRLQAFALEHRLAVLIVHHLTKGWRRDDPLSSVAGSTGVTGAADAVLVLDRSDAAGGNVVADLWISGRDVAERTMPLVRAAATMRWRPDERPPAPPVDHRLTPQRQAVLDAFAAHPGPHTLASLEPLVAGVALSRKFLKGMVDGRLLAREERGRYTLLAERCA